MTQVASHFAKPPVNPYTPRAQEFTAQLEAERQPAAPAQPVQPVQPAQAQPAQPAPAEQPAAPTPQPIYAAQPVGVDPSYVTQLQQENAQQREALANLLQEREAYEAARAQQQLESALGADAFAELETVDPVDAQRIARATLNAIQPHLAQAGQQAQQAQQYAATLAQQTQQTLQAERLAATANRVRAVHPDIEMLAQNPAYNEFLQGSDYGMSRTRDSIAAEELRSGNAQYVIDLIGRFKGTVPQAAQAMTVAPVQTATSVGAPVAPVQDVPQRTLGELNSLYQMRQLTHDEYRAELAKLRAAQKA